MSFIRTIKRLSGLAVVFLFTSCDNESPMVNLGIDEDYYIYRMQKLDLHPALTGDKYQWTLIREDGSEEVLSTERDYIFLQEKEGVYTVRFDIIDQQTPFSHTFKVNVLHEEVEYSAYISKVYEFCPAPGQFVNAMPEYKEGESYADMLKKVEESISGVNDTMISLGGFGGYVTFGFDHTVINIPGQNDFRIWGNAFYELINPEKRGGSAEPGIVMVSYDVNCNGIPDDPWYELKGSGHSNPLTVRKYSITYHKPSPSHKPVPDENNSVEDTEYIAWTDNQGVSSYIYKNYFHAQEYYPGWVGDDAITFTGTRLPDNSEDSSGEGRYYILYAFDWGYVDNHPNEYADLNSFDISNAIDADGNPVFLPGADFIRVYTGLNQQCGWLGETSTELSKAQDLHIQLPGLPDPIGDMKTRK